ncbi:MAG: FAD:protein FMN transferase [Novosphingobium sp.]
MIRRCRPLLGTFVEITVRDCHADALGAAFEIIAHIHQCMSFHEAGSDLSRLRAARPGEAVEVDRETAAVLRLAIAFHGATDGLFDVTIGRQLVRSRFLPRDGIIHLGRFRGTTADIEVLDDRHVRLAQRVLIDLGGIAKGHAVDRAIESLIAAGVPAALVNAGGDLRMYGDQDWPVQLRDADNVARQMVNLRECALASSANLLERHRMLKEDHSPHIGRNGRPVLIDHRVSVIADRCIVADAMTKVAMVDPDLADEILSAHKGFVLRPEMLLAENLAGTA